jgi:hypothetical protein
VDHEILVNEPLGAEDDAFARIRNATGGEVSEADSAQAVADLVADGTLDACRVPVDVSEDAEPPAIAWGPSFTDDFIDEAVRQLKELGGGHAVTSEFEDEIVAFFDSHR